MESLTTHEALQDALAHFRSLLTGIGAVSPEEWEEETNRVLDQLVAWGEAEHQRRQQAAELN